MTLALIKYTRHCYMASCGLVHRIHIIPVKTFIDGMDLMVPKSSTVFFGS